MKNCFIVAPNKMPSILEKKLLEVFKSQKQADFFYSKLVGDDFKSMFGDWQQRYEDINNPNVVMTGPTYSNGEPKLFQVKGAEQYYVQLPNGTRMYLNQKGLRGAFTPSEIKEVSRYFLFKYVQFGGAEAFNNIEAESSQSKMMTIIEGGIYDLIEQQKRFTKQKDIRVYGQRIRKIQAFKKEFRAQLTYELDSLGQKFLERVRDADGNFSSEVPEDSRVGGVSRQESVTINPKDTATINTKIMLSQLRSRKYNKTTRKKEFVKSPYLGTPMFEDFDVVWKALTPLLADNPTTTVDGQVSSSYSKMKTIVREVSDIYPWAEDLDEKLEDMYGDNSNNRHKAFEFVQAFNKTKLLYYVTEVDKKDKTYNFYNATSTVSRESFVLDAWGTSFSNKFLSKHKRPKLKSDTKEEIEAIREDIKEIRTKFNELKTEAKKNRKKRDAAIMFATKKLFPKLVELGFTTLKLNDINRYIYLGGGKSKEMDIVDKLFNSVDFMIKDSILEDASGEPIVFVDSDGNASSPFRSQANIKMLAQAVAMRELDVSEQNIVGPDGKNRYAYSNHTYVSQKIAEFKDDDTTLQSLAAQTINKSSRWMHYLLANHITNNEEERKALSKKRLSKFKSTMSSSFTSKGKNDAIDNTKISLDDQINDNLSKSLRGAFVKGGSIFPTIIAGDKTRRMEFSGLEYVNSRIYKKDGNLRIPPRTVGIFFEYFASEFQRMLEVARELESLPKNEHVIHYHLGNVNGLKSQIFPELSHENLTGDLRKLLYLKNGRPRNYMKAKKLSKKQREGVLKHIEKSLINRYYDTKIELDHIIENTAVDSKLMNHYRNNGDRPALIGDYMVNGLISTIEYTKMFSGDPAYYKDSAELIKRMPGTYSDGLPLALEDNDDVFFNAAVVKGIRGASKYKQLIEDSLDEKDKSVAEPYDNVNITDAQAWITPRRWRFINNRLGRWGDDYDAVFNKLYTGETLEPHELKLAAQPLKGVYFDINNGVPTYLKYSQAVLIPSMIKGGPMQRLLDKMQGETSIDEAGNVVFEKSFSEEVHEVITEDGIKVGAKQPSTIHDTKSMKLLDEFELNSHKMFNTGWKLQQDLPVKNMRETDLGSQVQKNILDNLIINSKSVYKMSGYTDGQKGEEVLSMVHNAASKLFALGVEKVSKELGIVDGVINNKDSLYDVLIKEFRDRNGNENILAALEKRTKFDSIPQIRGRIDSILMSVFNRATVKLATEGGSFIQVSPFGLEQTIEEEIEYQQQKLRIERDKKINETRDANERNALRNDYALKILNVTRKKNISRISIISDNYDGKGLKPPHKGKDGQTVPGQVMIPHTLALKLLRDAGEDMSRMTEGKLRKFFKDANTRELVGYRIPNQGMSSNDVLEIVGILPESMGDSIVGYDGIPAKTGSDFDIDKMYIMGPNMIFDKIRQKFEVITEENKKRYRGTDNIEKLVAQNNLLTLYKDILKSEHTYANMMTSIDSTFLKTDIEYLHKKSEEKDLDLFSPVTQLRIKKDYMDGQTGIGLAANNLIDSVANQSIAIGLVEDIGYGSQDPFNPKDGSEPAAYVEIDKDKEGEIRISHLLSAFLNAYVDIAKDNYITRGNHNDVTANVAFLMIRGGYTMKRLNRFIGQPILKEYVELIRRRRSITGNMLTVNDGKDMATPLDFLKEKYGFEEDPGDTFDASDLRLLSDKRLEENIFNQGQDEIANHIVLNAFADLELKAQKFSEGVLAAKVEKGAGGSPTELHVKRNKIAKVLRDGFIHNYDRKFYNEFRRENTAAGTQREFGLDFVNEVLERSEIQLSATKEAKETINVLSQSLKKEDYVVNLDFAKAVDKGMYAYMMSGTNLMKDNRDNFSELFVTLPEKIIEMQESGSKNYLIKELSVDHKGGYNFLGISSNNKPSLYQNDIYRAWIDLYENEETKEMAVDLVKYSYSQSGFSSNLSQFFTHIPHEILRDEGLNDDVESFFQNVKALPYDQHFKDQFIRHEAENLKVVTRLYDGDIKEAEQEEGDKKLESLNASVDNGPEAPLRIVASKDFAKKHMNLIDGEFVSNYPEFVSRRVGKKIQLYKMVDRIFYHRNKFKDKHGVPVYELTYKLGFKAGKNRIFEYKFGEEITESVVGWNKEQKALENITQQDAMDITAGLMGSDMMDDKNLSTRDLEGGESKSQAADRKLDSLQNSQGLFEC